MQLICCTMMRSPSFLLCVRVRSSVASSVASIPLLLLLSLLLLLLLPTIFLLPFCSTALLAAADPQVDYNSAYAQETLANYTVPPNFADEAEDRPPYCSIGFGNNTRKLSCCWTAVWLVRIVHARKIFAEIFR